MKKETVTISILIFTVLVLVPSAIERLYSKDGQMISRKLPSDSYCKNKRRLNSITEICTHSGGQLIYQESDGELIFKRELTENNCFKLSFNNFVITPSSECDIKETILTEISSEAIDRYISRCSPSSRYCIKHTAKGKVKKGGGIGFWFTPNKLLGLEIFEIEDTVENKILYREAKVRFGRPMKLGADLYWSENDNFLVFERNKRLYYLRLK